MSIEDKLREENDQLSQNFYDINKYAVGLEAKLKTAREALLETKERIHPRHLAWDLINRALEDTK